jgi:hypothetical protein
MRCVNVDILETEFLQRRFLDEADLVARYVDFEGLWDEQVPNDLCALVLCSNNELAHLILERCFGMTTKRRLR